MKKNFDNIRDELAYYTLDKSITWTFNEKTDKFECEYEGRKFECSVRDKTLMEIVRVELGVTPKSIWDTLYNEFYYIIK